MFLGISRCLLALPVSFQPLLALFSGLLPLEEPVDFPSVDVVVPELDFDEPGRGGVVIEDACEGCDEREGVRGDDAVGHLLVGPAEGGEVDVSGVSAGGVAIIVCLQPILVGLIAPRFTGESVSLLRWLGLALGFNISVVGGVDVPAGATVALSFVGLYAIALIARVLRRGVNA